MKKSKTFIIILSWQIIGFIATLIISLPVGNFHYFVHELILCLTFTNLIGLSGMLLILFYQNYLKNLKLSHTIKIIFPFLLFFISLALSLKFSMELGGMICGLDDYHVNRWHLSILAIDFVLMTTLSIIAMMLTLYNRLTNRLENKIKENEKLQHLQLESKLSLLQSKINPHFLFNTLNTMLDILKRDSRQVEKIILNIYRKTLMIPDHTLVTLKDEIMLVKEYLEIEKIRMGNRLKYKFYIDEKLNLFKVPPMIIQILVENAIKHGLTPKKEGGEVSIQVILQGETVMLEVKDSGIGIASSKITKGFGLTGIQQRLKLLYKNAKIEVSALVTGGTQVRIILPYAT
jgi:two-component system LytT family sensor kinase